MFVTLVLAACRRLGSDETAVVPTATSDGVAAPVVVSPSVGQFYVDSVEIAILESFPVQVQAIVNGGLSDSCTHLSGVSVQRQDTVFTINLATTHDNQAVCTQALVPFSQSVQLDVQGLPAGTYTVIAGGVSNTFNLVIENTAETVPTIPGTALTVGVSSAQPGAVVTLEGTGFPAGASIPIGIGAVNAEYTIIGTAQVGSDGRFTLQVTVPTTLQPGGQWVFVAEVNNGTVLSNPITIASTTSPVGVPVAGVNQPVNGLINRTYIYMIALEDGGQGGPLVGCNDSAIPIVVDIEPTVAPLTAAINYLLSLHDPYLGESGLYNALYQSNLALEGINIVNGQATISLTGTLQVSGVCDEPRILAQLEQTALQYSTVTSVCILLNGQPLAFSTEG